MTKIILLVSQLLGLTLAAPSSASESPSDYYSSAHDNSQGNYNENSQCNWYSATNLGSSRIYRVDGQQSSSNPHRVQICHDTYQGWYVGEVSESFKSSWSGRDNQCASYTITPEGYRIAGTSSSNSRRIEICQDSQGFYVEEPYESQEYLSGFSGGQQQDSY